MLKKDDRDNQMVYYQVLFKSYLKYSYLTTAIGWDWDIHISPSGNAACSEDIKGISVATTSRMSYSTHQQQTLDEAVAWNLSAHVMGTAHLS